MKNIFYIFFISLIASACSQGDSASIEYKNVYSVSLNGLHKKNTELTSLIAFDNQFEKTNFKLKEIDVDIDIDGIDIGTYFSREPLSLKAKSEIKIPLSYTFQSEKVQEKESSKSSFIVSLKGTATFTDEQGNEEKVGFNHKETVNSITNFKEKRKNRKDDSEYEELSKADLRKIRKEKKRDLKLEETNN